MDKNSQVMIHSSYGRKREERSSPSYRWDSSKRGGDPCVILQYTLKGTGILQNEKGLWPVGQGKALLTFVPEKASYYYPKEAKDPWVFSWINFEGELAISLWKALRDEFGPILDIPPQSPCAWAFARLVEKARARSFKNSQEEAEWGYHFFLLCRSQQQNRERSGRSTLREITEYYRQRSHEPVAVKEMAERAGLSREHFTRAFHKETGMSPAAYLRELRMKRAASLLKRTDMTVSEIARGCGFASARQFSKTFRHFRGKSPMEYRGAKHS